MSAQLPKRPGKRGGSAKSIPGTEETNVWQRFFYTHYGSCTWPPSVARAGGVMTVRGVVDGAAGTKHRHLLRGRGERARCLVWSVSDPESADVRHGAFPFRTPTSLYRKVQDQQFLHESRFQSPFISCILNEQISFT